MLVVQYKYVAKYMVWSQHSLIILGFVDYYQVTSGNSIAKQCKCVSCKIKILVEWINMEFVAWISMSLLEEYHIQCETDEEAFRFGEFWKIVSCITYSNVSVEALVYS